MRTLDLNRLRERWDELQNQREEALRRLAAVEGAMQQVELFIAELSPQTDEPEPEEGPVLEVVNGD